MRCSKTLLSFFSLFLQNSIIFLLFGFAFAGEDSSVVLEPIVISNGRAHLLNAYPLGYTDFARLPITSPIEGLSYAFLDLQSRMLKSAIQTDFSLRGSTYQGVLFLLDGQRINDPQTGHFNSEIPFTKEDIEQIDVMPGASSSVFGPDAIGGAVDVRIKKPASRKFAFEAKAGSHKTAGGLFSITEKINNLGLRLSLERDESAGFSYDTDFKKFVSDIASTLDIGAGEAFANFGYMENEFGAFDFYTPGSNYPSKEWTKTYLLNTGVNAEGFGFKIKPNFLWRRHFDKFMLDKTQIRTRYLNHHRTDMWTPNIYIQKEFGLLGKLGAGAEYGVEKINSTNLGKHNRDHKSLFVDDTKYLNSGLCLGASFRFDDYDSFGQVYTGSLNLKYNLYKGNSLIFGVSRNMRVPSFTELYYNDPTTLGNIDLSDEESVNYQLGYEYTAGKLSLEETLFSRQEKDMIDWVKNGLKFQAENITRDSIYGVESKVKYRFCDYLDLGCNYTYINKRTDDKGYIYKYGQNYLKHMANALLSLKLPFGAQTLGLTYKKKPVRKGWCLLDTRLSYHIDKHSRIFFNVTNLLNAEYQEIEGIPQPGRWLEGGMRFEW